jgi:hypothetical protein
VTGRLVSAALSALVLAAVGLIATVARGHASPLFDVGTPPPPPPKQWKQADFRELAALAESLRMNPADLLLVLASESSLDPAATYHDPTTGYPLAVGLNQLTSVSNAVTGLSEAQRLTVPSMSLAQQIGLVGRFFERQPWTKEGKTYPNAGVLYALNFAPSRVAERGTSLDTVLYDTSDGLAYRYNAGLDHGKKGKITIRDLVLRLSDVAGRPLYRGALAAMRAATGQESLSPNLPT